MSGTTSFSGGQLHLLCVLASTLLYIAADVLLKKTSDTGVWSYFAVSMFFYLLANILFVQVIKDGLASGFLLSAVLMSLGVVGASLLFFDESLSPLKCIALGLLILSTGLLTIPENQSGTSDDDIAHTSNSQQQQE